MQPSELLDRSRAQFDARLRAVVPADLDRPTPCEEWTVRVLIEHVVLGDVMAAALLRGATSEDGFTAALAVTLGPELGAEFTRAADALAAAFAEPGALERTVHHPSGDVTGAALLGFRAGDYTYHAWDLARATTQDETLDPQVVEALWTATSARHERMLASGMFGTGPSGAVPETAPVQERLLDLTGRRP